MKVYALVGKSGTGKSYSATNLCKRMNIETIIDDGLFIGGSKVLAGISAKRQATKVGAIKTALFTNQDHRAAVYDKIREINPASILVLGTSVSMVETIQGRLGLPKFESIIAIEEITTPEERKVADEQRHDLGKHVIPVPTFQLKKEFSGYFIDPLRIFKGWGSGKASLVEKSVVRPTYSYMGKFSISDKVIADIVSYIALKDEHVAEISKSSVENAAGGIKITLSAIMEYQPSLIRSAAKLQDEIAVKVEEMTAFNVEAVDIEIKGLRRVVRSNER